ncbi:MAG TPA: hypothetical protein H9881_09345 [Candidatus Stackebrandtia excrementipullorum]|nr:hypothetical protein [Candidatus Stackebrandtia excrementipullorum]
MTFDMLASPGDIAARGDEVTTLGGDISAHVQGSRGEMNPATPGLRTPGAFNALADAWTDHCSTVADQIKDIGDAITNSGSNHSANDAGQAGGFGN